MNSEDSWTEYENSFWADCGECAPALRKFVDARRDQSTEGHRDPREIVEREIKAVFRAGVNRHLRKALWAFLEGERKARGLTQEELADRAGITQPTYSKIKSGDSSFSSIFLVLRALDVELRNVPSPSVSEQSAEGLLAALDFVQHEMLGRGAETFKPRREDLEWLRHLQACPPWSEAFVAGERESGSIVADCIAAVLSLRFGHPVKSPGFAALSAFWQHWIVAWKFCVGAIWTEAGAA